MKFKRSLKFLKKFTAVLSASVLLFSFTSCSDANTFYQSQSVAMDTVMSQKIYARGGADKTAKEAEMLVTNLDKKLSAFSEYSEIYEINQNAGKKTQVSAKTFEIIKKGLELSSDKTDGFDISILPLSSLWKEAIDNKKLPSADKVSAAQSLVDDSKIALDKSSSSVTLTDKGMGLDLGALAKGAAIDEIYKIYKTNNIQSAICSLGTSAMLIFGQKNNGGDFKIGLRSPFETEQHFAVLSASDTIISTSGGYERYFEIDGEKYHHIIDPKTGYSAKTDIASCVVLGDSGIKGDFLSTRLFMLGFENAIKTAEKEGLSVILLSNDKKVYISKDIENKVELSAGFERVE